MVIGMTLEGLINDINDRNSPIIIVAMGLQADHYFVCHPSIQLPEICHLVTLACPC